VSSSATRYYPGTLRTGSSTIPEVHPKTSPEGTSDASSRGRPESTIQGRDATNCLTSPTGITDESLLALINEDDKEALASLFRRYARIVRGVAYRVLRDASEADDLLQDIFLLIHRKCGMFDAARGPARFWILQMTYHRAIARRRYLNSRHFYTRVDLDDAENDMACPANGSLGFQASGDGLSGDSGLKNVFEALSEDQQETLRLFFVEGYTLTEIATKLNQSRGNVKHHYFRGLEKLRKHFFDGKLRGNSAV
jgi:RNA polymerase sigma-70 factor, ECF subfamily